MDVTYERVSHALLVADPFRWTWGPPAGASPRVTPALERRVARLRARASAEHVGRAMGDIAHLLGGVDPARRFGLFPDVPRLGGRHPVVLAHGPSLQTLLPVLAAHRDRLYLVAPLRTALRVAEAGVFPDIAVLADAAVQTSELSVRAWKSAPADRRRVLEEHATLLTEPLAPVAIHRGFARVRVFDNGLGWLPPEGTLPFWGSALLPSVCLPLALGAPAVAIGGMDMEASHGRACRTWSGRSACLDPKLAVAHGLLEALGVSLPGRFVDLSADSIAKRGFELMNVERLLAQPTASGTEVVPGATMSVADALHHVLAAADAFGSTITGMTAVASRVCALAASEQRSPELERLVRQMEHEWAEESAPKAALSLLQPRYLRALWQLREAGFTPQNPQAAVRMKARLIGPEIAGLESAYSEWLAIIRTAAGCPDLRDGAR
jgi:hypothetical protein